LLALKRAKEESDGLIGKLHSNIAESKQRVLQAQGELLSFDEDRMKKNSEDMRDNQEMMVRKAEEFRAKGDVLTRVAIKAPVSGVVTALKYFTVDGVIAPGTPIMDIVPQDDTLVIEAQLSPSDIDVVHQDLTARVMLTAYKSRSTPLLMGKVSMISPDIITDPSQQGMSSYYRMQVTVDMDDLKALKNITLYPGMPADVHVLTGSRSFFSYMLQPVTDSMLNAFREQ
jgi:HlyD family type I secretion membrane fusion protein